MSTSTVVGMDVQSKKSDRLKKLRDLHIKRVINKKIYFILLYIFIFNYYLSQNEARVNNHQEVIEEDKQMKLPSNWEARQRKADWLLNDDKLRQDAKEKALLYYIHLKFLNSLILKLIILGTRL